MVDGTPSVKQVPRTGGKLGFRGDVAGPWSVRPMYMYQKGPSKPSVKGLMDPAGAYKVLKREFERNYRSANRLPVAIYTHSTSTGYLDKANNRAEIKKFLSWAMKRKNVWVVTYRQWLDYLQNPVPASEMAGFMANYRCGK